MNEPKQDTGTSKYLNLQTGWSQSCKTCQKKLRGGFILYWNRPEAYPVVHGDEEDKGIRIS
jgi:hypothetical protein